MCLDFIFITKLEYYGGDESDGGGDGGEEEEGLEFAFSCVQKTLPSLLQQVAWLWSVLVCVMVLVQLLII